MSSLLVEPLAFVSESDPASIMQPVKHRVSKKRANIRSGQLFTHKIFDLFYLVFCRFIELLSVKRNEFLRVLHHLCLMMAHTGVESTPKQDSMTSMMSRNLMTEARYRARRSLGRLDLWAKVEQDSEHEEICTHRTALFHRFFVGESRNSSAQYARRIRRIPMGDPVVCCTRQNVESKRGQGR